MMTSARSTSVLGLAAIQECSDQVDKHCKEDVTACFIVPSYLSTEAGILLASEPFSAICPW